MHREGWDARWRPWRSVSRQAHGGGKSRMQRGGPEQESCKQTGLRMESKAQGVRAAERSSKMRPAAEPSAPGRRTAVPKVPPPNTPPPLSPGCLSPLESTLSTLAGSCQPSQGPADTWISLLLPPWRYGRRVGAKPQDMVCRHLPFLFLAAISF